MADGSKIIRGLQDAVEHTGKHAGCQHIHCKEIRTGKKQCRLCGCIIYETYADYVG